MAITNIKRDWGVEPSMVRINLTDTLNAITTNGYLITQIDSINALNYGDFVWDEDDLVAINYSGGEGFFTRDAENQKFVPFTSSAGAVNSVTGVTNEISVDNTDPDNPIVGLSDNPIIPGTGSLTLPSGTTAQQPVSPAEAQIRYNTDNNEVEYWNGIAWVSLVAQPTNSGLIFTWTKWNGTGGLSGTYTPQADTKTMYVVIIGGGGGGGGAAISTGGAAVGGGGGAGGRCEFFINPVSGTYSWTLGEGGAGGAAGADGDAGTATTFGTFTAGGGAGGKGGTLLTAPGISSALAFGGDTDTTVDGATLFNYGGNGDEGIVFTATVTPLIKVGKGGTAGGISRVSSGYTYATSSFSTGDPGNNFGDGGNGGYGIGNGTARGGGNASFGLIVVYEYA